MNINLKSYFDLKLINSNYHMGEKYLYLYSNLIASVVENLCGAQA